MKLIYLGPTALAASHPALSGVDCGCLPPSCFAVEATSEAGIDGAVIEGDVLLVDERQAPGHDDLVVVERDKVLLLYRAHRIGGGFRLLALAGGEGVTASPDACRGVVISQARAG